MVVLSSSPVGTLTLPTKSVVERVFRCQARWPGKCSRRAAGAVDGASLDESYWQTRLHFLPVQVEQTLLAQSVFW